MGNYDQYFFRKHLIPPYFLTKCLRIRHVQYKKVMDTCKGDSGGSLQYVKDIAFENIYYLVLVLVGLTIFGIACFRFLVNRVITPMLKSLFHGSKVLSLRTLNKFIESFKKFTNNFMPLFQKIQISDIFLQYFTPTTKFFSGVTIKLQNY